MGRGVYSNYLLPLHRKYVTKRYNAATRLQAALRRLLAIMRLHRSVWLYGAMGRYGSNAPRGVMRRITDYETVMGEWLWETNHHEQTNLAAWLGLDE